MSHKLSERKPLLQIRLTYKLSEINTSYDTGGHCVVEHTGSIAVVVRIPCQTHHQGGYR